MSYGKDVGGVQARPTSAPAARSGSHGIVARADSALGARARGVGASGISLGWCPPPPRPPTRRPKPPKGETWRARLLRARRRLKEGDSLGLDALRRQVAAGNAAVPEGLLPVHSVLAHLKARGLFDDAGDDFTPAVAREYLEAMADGSMEATFVCDVSGGFSPGYVSGIQVYALLDWAAERKGITFAEVVARVLNQGAHFNFDRLRAKRRGRGRSASKRRGRSKGRSSSRKK
mmetsp:Transcript_4407/g.8936  ORF Transcript_4407/g.8936 Transcript_4407/m.8936 type:complete len:232 (-) Transcript_4407:67-762(-)